MSTKPLSRSAAARSRRLRMTVIAGLLLGAVSQGAVAEEAPAIPAWFLAHVAELTEGSGRWVTGNGEYESETEPADSYGIEWKTGLGGKSLKGRLFGLKDGEEIGTFWEFRIAWHPGQKQVLAYQFGADGTFGVGPMTPAGEHAHKMDQEFFSPAGTSYRVGHESRLEGGKHVTSSFDVAADGTWKPRRSYVWTRQP